MDQTAKARTGDRKQRVENTGQYHEGMFAQRDPMKNLSWQSGIKRQRCGR